MKRLALTVGIVGFLAAFTITEADAMLETWKESYYHAPGLRVFYLVPEQWLEYFLPLQISTPSELKRVLVGRIDLVRD